MTTNLNDVPDACTLPTAQRPLRRAEFDDLFATVVGRDRVAAGHLRLVLTAAEADVRDLTARETECCSFFRFTVSPRPDAAVLDIEVPPVQVAVLDAIESRLPASARELAERPSTSARELAERPSTSARELAERPLGSAREIALDGTSS